MTTPKRRARHPSEPSRSGGYRVSIAIALVLLMGVITGQRRRVKPCSG